MKLEDAPANQVEKKKRQQGTIRSPISNKSYGTEADKRLRDFQKDVVKIKEYLLIKR